MKTEIIFTCFKKSKKKGYASAIEKISTPRNFELIQIYERQIQREKISIGWNDIHLEIDNEYILL